MPSFSHDENPHSSEKAFRGYEMNRSLCQLVSAATALLLAAVWCTAAGAEGVCAHCGACCCCQKVWHPVPEEKKVEVPCWGCKCEEFCVPGPSCEGCQHCKTVCDNCNEPCDPKKPHSEPKKFLWTDWFPCCAQTYTRTKLMKKVETVKVPSYKWVEEDLCPQCAAEAKKAAKEASKEEKSAK